MSVLRSARSCEPHLHPGQRRARRGSADARKGAEGATRTTSSQSVAKNSCALARSRREVLKQGIARASNSRSHERLARCCNDSTLFRATASLRVPHHAQRLFCAHTHAHATNLSIGTCNADVSLCDAARSQFLAPVCERGCCVPGSLCCRG